MRKPSVFVEEGTILSHQAFEGDQYILRMEAPRAAATALPGSFAHIQCDPLLPMRRPISIMRAEPRAGWLEFLYKAVGDGTRLLARRQVGEVLNIMAPIGNPFLVPDNCQRPLLIGGGVGIPPMVFLAEALRQQRPDCEPLVIMGSEVPFPFTRQPSQIMVPGLPEGVIAAMPLMEDWGIASRLCSLQGYPGCFDGYVTDLARHYLAAMDAGKRQQVQLFSCGPQPMLAAVASLAREFQLPCQVSLEEYMACAIGGCAGCTVRVMTADGPAMKRVCVDGPVFDATTVFPA
jgi:dihydroorotate dehydrogenase electron transfer subunit